MVSAQLLGFGDWRACRAGGWRGVKLCNASNAATAQRDAHEVDALVFDLEPISGHWQLPRREFAPVAGGRAGEHGGNGLLQPGK